MRPPSPGIPGFGAMAELEWTLFLSTLAPAAALETARASAGKKSRPMRCYQSVCSRFQLSGDRRKSHASQMTWPSWRLGCWRTTRRPCLRTRRLRVCSGPAHRAAATRPATARLGARPSVRMSQQRRWAALGPAQLNSAEGRPTSTGFSSEGCCRDRSGYARSLLLQQLCRSSCRQT